MKGAKPARTRAEGLRADAVRNREAVIAAAVELAAEVGVANVTTDAVAARAQLGKGTLFRRFRTREALMAAVLARLEADWAERTTLPVRTCTRDQLVAFGREWASFLTAHRSLASAAGTAGLERHLDRSAPVRRVGHLLESAEGVGETSVPSLALLTTLEVPLVHASGERALPVDEALRRWDELVALLLRCAETPGG